MEYTSIDLAGVNLDLYEGPIGISASGGADSSILLYNLMKNKSNDKIYIFTTGLNPHRWHVKAAINVVEKCIQLTGNSNIEHYIKYTDTLCSKNIYSDMFFYLDHKIINIMYSGITKNPPKEVTDQFLSPESTESDRDPTVIREHLYQNQKLYTPFFNADKKQIAKMYEKDNLIEDLYPLTKSCDYDLHHCGKCWWCQEREWGFGRLA